MNLRTLAEADNEIILEDDTAGFGVAIKLTEPNDSVAVAAVLTVLVNGVDGTILPAGTQWMIGDELYTQGTVRTIATGTATANLTANVAGADGNQDTGTVAETVNSIAGVTYAEVSGTTTAGVDRDPDVVHEVKGQYTRKGVEIDPETGLLVPGNSSAFTVRLSRLNGSIPDDGWLIESTDITGATVKGKAVMVMLDRTAGRATMMMRK